MLSTDGNSTGVGYLDGLARKLLVCKFSYRISISFVNISSPSKFEFLAKLIFYLTLTKLVVELKILILLLSLSKPS